MGSDMVTRLVRVYMFPLHELFIGAWTAVLVSKLHHELAKVIMLKYKRLFQRPCFFFEGNLVVAVL